MSNDAIYHWGIKGRKWGVRKQDEYKTSSAERMHYATESRKLEADDNKREIAKYHDKTVKKMNRDTNRAGKKIAKIRAKTIVKAAMIGAATVITALVVHGRGKSATDSITHSEELMHYGIRGMRWGIRKDDHYKTTSEERMYYAKLQQKAMADSLKANAARREQDNYLKISKDHDRALVKQTKIKTRGVISGIKILSGASLIGLSGWRAHKYKLAKLGIKAGSNSRNKAVSNSIIGGLNASTIRQATGKEPEKKKSKTKKTPSIVINNMNSNIAGTTSVRHGAFEMNTDELFHYGIRGMKWGVRRYQDADGSLTEAGKARYNQSTLEPLDARDMTNAQLSSATNRLNMERSYNMASGHPSRNPGYKAGVAKGVAATIAGTFAASALASLVSNKFNKNNKLTGKELAKRSLANGAIAAGISGLIVLGRSFGGTVNQNTPIDQAMSNGGQQNKKKEGSD